MTIHAAQTVNTEVSVFDCVAAPAPRYLMRLSQVEKLIRALPRPPLSFLEVGPGMGDVSYYLVRRFPGIQGQVTDISDESIAIVADRLGDYPRLAMAVSDFTTMQGYGEYDLVVACEVFEHLEDDDAAFASVHRLLSDEGHFLFSAPAFMKKWGPADEYGGHVRRYEKRTLVEQFERHGFSLVHFWSYGFPVTNVIAPLSRRYYRKAQDQAPLDRGHATKRSGTERTVASRFRRTPFRAALAPFFLCQHWFRNKNIGDGYVVLARKGR